MSRAIFGDDQHLELRVVIEAGAPELLQQGGMDENLRSFGSSVDVISAGSFVSLLVPLLLLFLFQRYFVQGLLAGSVKG